MIFQESQIIASVTKQSFYEFVKEFWSSIITETPSFNWHIEYLCNEMQELAERVFRNEPKAYDLIANMPPGSTKSTVCSQMFPAWVWTRMPAAKFICGSYAYDVALKDSVKTRDIVQCDLYQQCFPYIKLREDENTKGHFSNTQRGFRYTVGIGGAVTGFHGHFLLVDDPLNPEQAYSTAELKVANRWMSQTLPSRKIDKRVSVMVLVQQRLHQADPTGDKIEKSKGKGIKHICLPGELTDKVNPPELARFYVDGLFDPIRLDRNVLKEQEKDLGAYGYASQFLQDPVPLGGGQFQTDKLVLEQHLPISPLVAYVRSWDKAGTQDGGAWSVGVLMGVDKKGRYWVLDVVRGQWGSRKREDNIKATATVDGVNIPVLLEIEGGSGGKESGENTVANLAGYRVITFHPTGDKEARAYPFSSQVGGGNVHVLVKDWTRDYIEELRYFPNGRYKDQVDASSAAFNFLSKRKAVVGGF